MPETSSSSSNVGRRFYTLAEIERAAILKTVSLTGSPVEAAKLLEIGVSTIYRKLRQYDEESKAAARGESS